MSDNSKDNIGDETLEFGCNISSDKSAVGDETGSSFVLLDKAEESKTAVEAQRARDSDPVKVLQLSQNIFVSDSMEDDDDLSVIIPPTPADDTVPFIIPSTPTDRDCGSPSLMDETLDFAADIKKSDAKKQLVFTVDDDDDDDDEWSKPTQPIIPLKTDNIPELSIDDDDSNDETFADTEALFASCLESAPPPQSTPIKASAMARAESPAADDDEWNLHLTATQPTQPLGLMPHSESDSCQQRIEEINGSSHVVENVEPPDVRDVEPLKDSSTEENIEQLIMEVEESEKGAKETSSAKDEKLDEGEKSENEVRDADVRMEKEGTPEAIRLFAEIEKIVQAARESEKKFSESTLSNDDTMASQAESITSDHDSENEIAPSQTSTVSVMSRSKAKLLEEVKAVVKPEDVKETPLLVPETAPFEESEGNHMEEPIDLPETELFVKDEGIEGIKASPMKSPPRKKASRLTKSSRKKTSKKVISSSTSDSADSLTVPKDITEKQLRIMNGNSEQQSITASPGTTFRPPIAFVKKSQRTPQKGRVISDFSPKFDIKPCDTTLVPDSESSDHRHHLFKYPKRVIGSYSDDKSLESLLQSVGVSMDDEKLKAAASLNTSTTENDFLKVKLLYRIYSKEDKVYEEFSVVDDDDSSSHIKVDISPMNSSSVCSSNKTSSFTSLQSGDMGDISSSMSLKSQSGSLSSVKIDGRVTQDLSLMLKASQKSESELLQARNNFTKKQFDIFTSSDKASSQDDFKNPVVILSPIKSDKRSFSVACDNSDADAQVPKPKKAKTTRKAAGKKGEAKKSGGTESKRTKKNTALAVEEVPSSSEEFGKPPIKKLTIKTAPKKNGRKNQKNNTNESSSDCYVVEDVPRPFPSHLALEETGEDPSPFGNILPGVRVMARWKDGYYYPGIVQGVESDGRWWVEFDDGAVRVVTQDSLLKIALLQIGTKVLALSPDNYYDPGTVSSHYRDGDDMGYVVEQESGLTRRYKRAAVILSTEQAKLITNARPVAPTSLTINLDNIIGGKRKRKTSQNQPEESPAPQAKAVRSTRKKNPDPNLDSTEASGNETVVSKRRSSGTVQAEASVEGKSPPATRRKQTRGRAKKPKKASKKAVAAVVEKPPEITSEDLSISDASLTVSNTKPTPQAVAALPDAIPVGSSKLFQGYAFLLTHAIPKHSESNVEKPVGDVPFDKEHLCKVITQSGGTVLETFEDAQKSTTKKVVLLANTHLRTIKYIQCVAANIPCIQQYWVQCSVSNRQIMDTSAYVLPTGYSIMESTVVEWHGQTDIFKGLKIVITSEKKNDFVNIWTPVLLAAKADLVQKWNLPSFAIPGTSFLVDLVVSNASCPANVLNAAKKGKIPVVSSEYIIQCIVAGKRLPHNGHPKFRHDFKE